jgi:hypothetical protein
MPEKRWKKILGFVLFVFGVLRGRALWGLSWDVMGWNRPPHGFATCAC